MIHLKCTVVHYANLNSGFINKSFLNYGPLNMLFHFLFKFHSLFFVYFYFNEAFFQKRFEKAIILKLACVVKTKLFFYGLILL